MPELLLMIVAGGLGLAAIVLAAGSPEPRRVKVRAKRSTR
jgi:hypothetical protein